MYEGTMEITTKIGCKVNCKFCPQRKLIQEYNRENKKGKEFLTLEEFKFYIDKIPKEVRIDFSGMCEPWLNPDCTRMVQYASDTGHRIAVFTTLTGMTLEDIEILEKLNIEQIVIHIADTEQNAHISIDENYKEILKRLVNIKIDCNKGLSCHGTIPKALKEILNDKWKIADKFIDRAGNIADNNLIQTNDIKGELFCSLSGKKLNHNVLLPDGRVLLCCMDYGIKHVIGNLKTDSYKEIMEGAEIKSIRNKVNKEESNILCRKCSNAIPIKNIEEKYLEIKESNDKLWKAKQWFQEEYEKKEEIICELQEYIKKLEEAKEYLAGKSEVNEKQILEQKKWIKELEEAKEYLAEKSERNEEQILEQKKWIEELEKAKEYLAGNAESKEKIIISKQTEIENFERETAELKNNISKLNYKLATLKEDKIIQKIISWKKYNI